MLTLQKISQRPKIANAQGLCPPAEVNACRGQDLVCPFLRNTELADGISECLPALGEGGLHEEKKEMFVPHYNSRRVPDPESDDC